MTLAIVFALSGCVSQGDTVASSVCPVGTTYSCTSYVGKTRQCACVSRDELREILDPVVRN